MNTRNRWEPVRERRSAIRLRRSFLLAIWPELLEVGPKVRDVLVVLETDECHAGTRHRLHGRANVSREVVRVPGNPGGLVGLRIGEALESAGLAAINAV